MELFTTNGTKGGKLKQLCCWVDIRLLLIMSDGKLVPADYVRLLLITPDRVRLYQVMLA